MIQGLENLETKHKVKLTVPLVASYLARGVKRTKIAELCNISNQAVYDYCDRHYVDNIREFSGHKEIASKLDVDVYFAHPDHLWERELDENTNGLLRQFYPKKTDICKVLIEHVLYMLNSRPNNAIILFAPDEVFNHRSY